MFFHLANRLTRSRGEDEWDDETVQTQYFSKDEDQDHAYVETWLLGSAADTGVTDNADSEASSETREADAQASAQVMESPSGKKVKLQKIFEMAVTLNYWAYLNKEYWFKSMLPAMSTATTRP